MYSHKGDSMFVYTFDRQSKYGLSKIKINFNFQCLPAPYSFMRCFHKENELLIQQSNFTMRAFDMKTFKEKPTSDYSKFANFL